MNAVILYNCLQLFCRLTCGRARFRDAAAWVLYCLIGDLCNLTGAFLSNQTFLQVNTNKIRCILF